MRRNILAFGLVLLLICACACPVTAEGRDSGKSGSMTVTLTAGEQAEPIMGAQLSVYYVATVTANAEGNLHYAYTVDFQGFAVPLDDPDLANKLNAYLPKEGVPYISLTTDEKGGAACGDLALGLYFVKQTGAVEGYAPCTPFLVTVPYGQEGKFVYDVIATPKTEAAKLTDITIQKVWNTDASTGATDSVTVQLLRGGIVIETAVLNEQNGWQVTYTDLPESDAYTVKEVNVPKGFTATYKQSGYAFTVTNTSTLIQTGQLLWPIPVLAACGMLLIAAGVWLLRKKRAANE